MIGAVIGDIAGSRFEFPPIKSKDFELLSDKSYFTDDTVMTIAVCEAFTKTEEQTGISLSKEGFIADTKRSLGEKVFRKKLSKNAALSMQAFGRRYPDAGYGTRFGKWIYMEHPHPLYSCGNGAGMRVSACAYAARTLQEAVSYADCVTKITHDHPDGIKGARCVSAATFLARTGMQKDYIRYYIERNFYPLGFTVEEARESCVYSEKCQDTVPQAMVCFLEADSFEDSLRNAVSLGGDADTIAAMAGAVAEPYFGVPESLREKALSYLDGELKESLLSFEKEHPPEVIST